VPESCLDLDADKLPVSNLCQANRLMAASYSVFSELRVVSTLKESKEKFV